VRGHWAVAQERRPSDRPSPSPPAPEREGDGLPWWEWAYAPAWGLVVLGYLLVEAGRRLRGPR